MPSPRNVPSTTTPTGLAAIPAALDARREALMAMPGDRIQRSAKLDVGFAAETVMGRIPQIAPHRAALVALFGAMAGTLVDGLLTDARAAKQADVELLMGPPNGDYSEMEADVRAEHTLLITDAQSLANRRLLDAPRIEPARSVASYRALIQSTLALVALFNEKWPLIKDHTPITQTDLVRAANKADAMLLAIGEREQGSTRAPAAELRVRALSALLNNYDQVRRMLSYLRWEEDDADAIAPSLYARRGARRQREEDGVEPTTTPTTPTSNTEPPVASPVTGVPASPFVT
jgi:hypothetical protein